MARIIGREARYNAYLAMLKEDFTPYAEIEVLNPDGSTDHVIGNEFIADGSVNVNFNNGTRRTAQITLENTYKRKSISPNSIWFGQQYRIKAGLYLPDGTPYILPQGVFYIRDPEIGLQPSATTLSLNLTDKWAYLDGTLFGNLAGNFVAEINTDIYEIISAVLGIDRGNGYPIDNIPPLLSSYFKNKTVQLPDGSVIPVTNVPYTMRVEPQDKTLADILLELNDMLTGIIGYDNTGRLRIEPSNYDMADYDKANLWEFEPTEKEFLGGTYSVKMSQVYNVVQVVGAVLNGMQAQAEVSNLDATSPTSVQSSLGRRIKRLTSDVYYSDEQCAALGLWHLKRLNVLQQSVSFTCSPMYHLQENMLVSVPDPQKNNELRPHLVNGFTLPLGLGQMQVNVTSINDDDTSIFSQRIVVTRVLENVDTSLYHIMESSMHSATASPLGNGRINNLVDTDIDLVSLPTHHLSATLNNIVESSVELTGQPIAPLLAELANGVRLQGQLLPRQSAPARGEIHNVHTAYGELWGRLTSVIEAYMHLYVGAGDTADVTVAPSAGVGGNTSITEEPTAELIVRSPQGLQGKADEYQGSRIALEQRLPQALQGILEAVQNGTVTLSTMSNTIPMSGREDNEVSTVGNLIQRIVTPLEAELEISHYENGQLHALPPTPLQAIMDGRFDATGELNSLPPTALKANTSFISGAVIANMITLLPTYLAGSTSGYHGSSAYIETSLETILAAEMGAVSGTTAELVSKALAIFAARTSFNHGVTGGMADSRVLSISATNTSRIRITNAGLYADDVLLLSATESGRFDISTATLVTKLPQYLSAVMGGQFGVERAFIDEIPQGDLSATNESYSSAIANLVLGDVVDLIAIAEGHVDSDPDLGLTGYDKAIASVNGEGKESASMGVIAVKSLEAFTRGTSTHSTLLGIILIAKMSALLSGRTNITANLGTMSPVSLTATMSAIFNNMAQLDHDDVTPNWNVYIDLGTIRRIHAELTAPPTTLSGEIHYSFTTASLLDSPFIDITLPSGYVIVENDFNDYVEPDCVYSATLYNTGQRDSNGDIIIGLSIINWTLSMNYHYEPQNATVNGTSGESASMVAAEAKHLEVLSTGTFGADATLYIINLIHWNKYYNKGTITGITATLLEPPTNLTGEIHVTFTTDSSISTNFWNITVPTGYSIVENEYSDTIEPNRAYESTIYNTGQEDSDGNIILGISTIEWS